MSTVNRTFSIDVNVDKDLHFFIKKRGMSHFVNELIRRGLQEKRDRLSEEYASANEDEGQQEAMRDWSSTETDGLGDHNDW